MKTRNLVATLAAALTTASGMAHGAEILRTEHATMEVSGRLQLLAFAQKLDDGARNDERLYLFLKQGRLGVAGNVDAWRYKVLLAFGGEDEIKAPTPGISLGLLDMYVDIPVPVLGKSYVRVGQFKVPYGRERLTDSGELLFADRSIQNLAFRVGRDVGATFHTQAGPLVAGLGIFTGGGRDIPERYLPQTLGTPLFVLRAGYDSGLGEDVFATRAPDATVDTLQTAFFVNGFYVKDSLVGHSTVFNTKSAEKPLLINGNWNPYVGQAPFNLGKLWQLGADAAVRAPAGPGVLSAEVEGNFGVYQNEYGDIRVAGGRAQVGYQWKPVELALRYAFVRPDENFAVGETRITGTHSFKEIAPSLTYTFTGFNAKIIMDLPIQMGAPVIFEEGVGSYVLTEQPDQTSLLKKAAPLSRQTVVAGRMLVQASF
jgi:hypothetical protein